MRIEFGPELPGRAGGGRIPSRGGSQKTQLCVYIPNLTYNIYQYDYGTTTTTTAMTVTRGRSRAGVQCFGRNRALCARRDIKTLRQAAVTAREGGRAGI